MADEVIPSFNAQLRALPKGESLPRAKRFPIGSKEAAGINEVLSALRRNVNAAVSRIRDATGSNFRVESGCFITSDNEAVLAVVTVTRL